MEKSPFLFLELQSKWSSEGAFTWCKNDEFVLDFKRKQLNYFADNLEENVEIISFILILLHKCVLANNYNQQNGLKNKYLIFHSLHLNTEKNFIFGEFKNFILKI